MITNREIADTYLAYKNKKRTATGKRDDTLPLMPFYIMDTCYQIYCKDIKDLPCKHEMKRAKKRWSECYHRFTTDFFMAFNQDQTDYIVDQMDEFNDYIHTTVVMLKSAVMNSFTTETPFEDKKNLAALLACNALAQAAQHLYKDMYRKADMKGETNIHIEGVQKASYDIARFYPVEYGVDITESDKVMEMIDVLCKKIVKFLTVKANQ